MTSKTQERIIKPPRKSISTGKVFRPSNKFLYKKLTIVILVAVLVWSMIIGSVFGIMFLISLEDGGIPAFLQFFEVFFPVVNYMAIVLNLVWVIPSLVFTPAYVRRIEYSVITETGESMPEIYVKKGLLNITRKHVPFRSITNISSRVGPFDRLFGIGTVEIETAGYHNPNQMGPEAKLEGITFYEEVRDYILNQLRKFSTGNTLTTEPMETPIEPNGINAAMLHTLREIRDLLKQQSS